MKKTPAKKASPPASAAKKAATAKKAVGKAVGKTTARPLPKPTVKAVSRTPAKSSPKVVAKAAPAKATPKPAAKAASVKAAPASSRSPARPAAPPAPKAAPKPQAHAVAAPSPAPGVPPAPPPLKKMTSSAKSKASAKAQAAYAAPAPLPIPTSRFADRFAPPRPPTRQMNNLDVDSPKHTQKSDPKLANAWKTKTGRDLTEPELLAMPESEYMNDKQLDFFRATLQRLKDDLLSNAGETTEHLREDTSIVPDPADRATIEEEHALELRTRDRERKLLKKISQSLTRIESGDYGFCDETGEPIGLGRLIARPTATLSLEAQQRRELKQKMFGD